MINYYLFVEGSQSNISGGTEGDRGPAAMARAVTVHQVWTNHLSESLKLKSFILQDTMKVMYFA